MKIMKKASIISNTALGNDAANNYISRNIIHVNASFYSIIIYILLCLLLCAGSWEGLRQDQLVRPVAEKILRFRVLANSDSEEDQQMKLMVRDGILDYLEEHVGNSASVDEMVAFISNRDVLEALAQGIAANHSQALQVDISLEDCYFPEKTYGDLTFPRGTYRALKVEIGAADGANWWCVLYPELCFTDVVTAVVPEESQQKLEHVLAEDDYQILAEKPEVRFWFLDVLGKWFR